jgi:hypothetical protein
VALKEQNGFLSCHVVTLRLKAKKYCSNFAPLLGNVYQLFKAPGRRKQVLIDRCFGRNNENVEKLW